MRRSVCAIAVTCDSATSTFAFGSSAEMRRYLEGDEELFLYTRYANPTLRWVFKDPSGFSGGPAVLHHRSKLSPAAHAVCLMLDHGEDRLGASGFEQPIQTRSQVKNCSFFFEQINGCHRIQQRSSSTFYGRARG